MEMKKCFFSLFLFFFLGITFAENYCADDSFNSSLIISNDYSSNEYFTVSYAASPGLIIHFKDSLDMGFFVPGQEKILNYEIILPFKGEYSLTFEISDSRANKEIKHFDFNVFDCRGVDVKIFAQDNYCLRQTAPYQVFINNTGNYAEDLKATINNEIFNFQLLPGESKTYELEFYSSFLHNNLISVLVENDFIKESAEQYVNLRNCDATGILFESIKACPGQLINSKLIIKNLGSQTDAYQIINSSGGAIIEPQRIIIESGNEKHVDFSIFPGCDEKGIKNAEIYIQSLYSG
ncbi:MAG: hypothetical protein PHG04_02300, partial [Candidatus Nanoarchaeia archaeon]|nr:hypothetical protein [Candidatus Nanoarchaeia archaeon]